MGMREIKSNYPTRKNRNNSSEGKIFLLTLVMQIRNMSTVIKGEINF